MPTTTTFKSYIKKGQQVRNICIKSTKNAAKKCKIVKKI